MAFIKNFDPLPTSPVSSEEVDSPQATPATKISLSTPSNAHESIKSNSAVFVRTNIPPHFSLNTGNTKASTDALGVHSSSFPHADPFTSVPNGIARFNNAHQSKLSPVATAFTPSVSRFSSPDSGSEGLSSSNADTGRDTDDADHKALKKPFNEAANHHLDHARPGAASKGAKYRYPYEETRGGASLKYPTFDRMQGIVNAFTSESDVSRSLIVSRYLANPDPKQISSLIHTHGFRSANPLIVDHLHSKGCIYLTFGDIRDAVIAQGILSSAHPEWQVHYIKAGTLIQALYPYSPVHSPFIHEGEVGLSAKYLFRAKSVGDAELNHTIVDILERYGQVKAMSLIAKNSNEMLIRCEFFDADAVEPALVGIKDLKLKNIVFDIARYEAPSSWGMQASPSSASSNESDDSLLNMRRSLAGMNLRSDIPTGADPQTPGYVDLASEPKNGLSFSTRKAGGGSHVPPPLSLNNGLVDDYGSEYSMWSPANQMYSNERSHLHRSSPPYTAGVIGERRAAHDMARPQFSTSGPQGGLPFKPRTYKFRDSHGKHHNYVDLDRIYAGRDMRTTIMVRNIPNKIDHQGFKEIIDETSRGKYDFIYLRIDFGNNCNVGYGFINFVNAYDIIEFARARIGRGWNRFNSDKITEICYATIQSRESLISKFRNSSVMKEPSPFRPKLYYAGNGPLAGTEQPFPPADNLLKLRRSCDNAQNIGLFEPKQNQALREEERRRRSQYDRGTRLAEMENANYGLYHSGGAAPRYRTAHGPQ